MSRLAPSQMTVRKVESLKDGTHSDGGNLWITVKGKSRTWSFRFNSPVTGKRREMGLGPARDVTLAAARELAGAARKLVRQGIDPIEQRRVEKVEQARQNGLTFKAVAERYIEDQKAGWRGPQSAFVWTSSLARLAYPAIGEKTVGNLVTDDIVSILRPIWTTRTETADRLRGRIERVLDYARTQGWREGENPARWRGHLAHILPKPSTVAQVEHHAAIPYRTIALVMAALARSGGMGAMAVRYGCPVWGGPRRHLVGDGPGREGLDSVGRAHEDETGASRAVVGAGIGDPEHAQATGCREGSACVSRRPAAAGSVRRGTVEGAAPGGRDERSHGSWATVDIPRLGC